MTLSVNVTGQQCSNKWKKLEVVESESRVPMHPYDVFF